MTAFRRNAIAPTIVKSPSFYLRRTRDCREKLIQRVDPDDLHEFRTSLRHLEAALRLEKSLLGDKRYDREKAGIKYLLGLTGPLREADVAARLLLSAGLRVRKESPEQRRRREEAFQAILASPHFESGLREMVDWLEPGTGKARRKMRSAFKKEITRLKKILGSYESKGPRRKNLHRLRIQAKRLRYDLEQFEFLHPTHRKRLLKAVRDVHHQLGLLRDLQTAGKSLAGKRGNPFWAMERKKVRDSTAAIRRLEGLVP